MLLIQVYGIFMYVLVMSILYISLGFSYLYEFHVCDFNS